MKGGHRSECCDSSSHANKERRIETMTATKPFERTKQFVHRNGIVKPRDIEGAASRTSTCCASNDSAN
jgi:hypothetical protein